MQISRWTLLGIVLSVAWIIGAGLYQRDEDIQRADGTVNFGYKVCTDTKALAHDTDLSSCETERAQGRVTWMEGSWEHVASFALAPLPFGWFGGFILLYTVRIVRAGVRAVVPWHDLSGTRRGLVAACFVASIVAVLYTLLFALVAVMDLYLDTKVPVTLGPFASVSVTGDGIVTARGTWTRTGLTDASTLANPLQESTILCERSERRCTEAQAYVFGNLLSSSLLEYDVVSWSATTVVFKNEALCATEVLTIDLVTESVNGMGRPSNLDNEFCKRYGPQEKEWNYHLSEGTKVYWAEREKALPTLLRVIQAFFGH
jgi:hypothetical protein